VATLEEGVELRQAGIKTRILVMEGLMGAGSPASERIVEANLTPVIHSSSVLESLESAAAKAGRTIGVHLKVDTGMSRLGARPESLSPLLKELASCPHLSVEGAMTHLSDAGEETFSAEQMDIFLSCRQVIEKALGEVGVWHVANSLAVLRGQCIDIPGAQEAWVRPGLALYGEGDGTEFGGDELWLVMGLVSRVVMLKTVPANTCVSYGRTFTTTRRSRLGIVPMGYADGYPWSASGKAQVLVRGRRVPVVGRVTMDMIVLDVTDVEGVTVGDEVVLLGRQGNESIALAELAQWSGTITYEVLCRVSKRMPRIYKGEKSE
jgi:alanine racemase